LDYFRFPSPCLLPLTCSTTSTGHYCFFGKKCSKENFQQTARAADLPHAVALLAKNVKKLFFMAGSTFYFIIGAGSLKAD